MRKEKQDEEKEFFRRFGERIKEIRTSKNITQKELADYLRINRVIVSNYESGDVSISLFTALKICSFFEISINYLINNDPFVKEKINHNVFNLDVDSYLAIEKVIHSKSAHPDYRKPEEKGVIKLQGLYLGKNQEIINYIHQILRVIMLKTNYKTVDFIKDLKDINIEYKDYSSIVDYYNIYLEFVKSLYADEKKNKKYIDIIEYLINKADVVDRTFIISNAGQYKEQIKKDIQELLNEKADISK
jgi:transcriptional regulator with XRE-family HTH domain